MNDQARALRDAAARAAHAPAPAPEAAPGTSVVVFAGGKGGVGASTLTVLAGAALARAGRRVLLVDGAQNQGALHLLLGVAPRHSLAELVEGGTTVGAITVPVAERLALLPADTGSRPLYALSFADRARLHLRLTTLFDDHDVVLVDAGAGLESAVRVAAMRARLLVAVSTPDPIALSLTHALVKTVHTQLPTLALATFVQRAADAASARAAQERLGEAAQRFLGCALNPLGWLVDEASLRAAGSTPGALLDGAPAESAAPGAPLGDLVLACDGGCHVG